MNSQTSNVIRVRLERSDLFVRVIVEDAQLEVVRTGYKPVLSGNKAHASHRYLCNLECLDESACFMVIDIDASVVQTGQEPWLCRMKIDCFDAVRSLKQFSLKFRVVSYCQYLFVSYVR